MERVKERWTRRTFLQPLAIISALTLFISVNGVDCPLNFYGPRLSFYSLYALLSSQPSALN